MYEMAGSGSGCGGDHPACRLEVVGSMLSWSLPRFTSGGVVARRFGLIAMG